ncbi:MAG: TRAM domain-containing protein [Synergistaceae bacterium]|nr:TRAM domain-containing protein [Synergistaceae bacterium]
MPETGINGIMKIALRFLLTLIGGIAGYQLSVLILQLQLKWVTDLAHPNIWTAFSIILFALFGYILTPVIWWLLNRIGQIFESMLQNVSIPDIAVALMGLILSLLLANLFAIPLIGIPGIGFYVAIALNIIFAFVGMRAFLKRRDDVWAFALGLVGLGGRFTARRSKDRHASSQLNDVAGGGFAQMDDPHSEACKKVVDTSSLIDGRILDIAMTGFLEGTLVLPRFVLTELQGVADSSEPARRARGRKGLTVVSDLQKIESMTVSIEDISMRELKRDKVDEALVELCKKLGAKIITTDYNLNQISRIEGIPVLNVNELANSLKPQFLPGEVVKIDIIRPGKEHGQGIGYLEDGTMLVVEDGSGAIGETVEVVITSMLQTAAGRMVFGKLRR